jgi:hypothetical protein
VFVVLLYFFLKLLILNLFFVEFRCRWLYFLICFLEQGCSVGLILIFEQILIDFDFGFDY